MNQTWVNGVACDHVSAFDRGLNYGDGVFETIRVVNHEMTLWSYHRDRLLKSTKWLSIDTDIEDIEKELSVACASQANSVIKLIVSRGVGGRGYMPAMAMEASRIITVNELPNYPIEYYEAGVDLRVCDLKIGSNSQLAGLKHLNRLEQVLASFEMRQFQQPEGLLLDERGRVIEGIRTNLFISMGGILITPDLSKSGIAGVLREFILKEVAPALQIKAEVGFIDLSMLHEAEEVFVCNSVNGIWPVKSIDEKTYLAGSVTKQLQNSVHPYLLM